MNLIPVGVIDQQVRLDSRDGAAHQGHPFIPWIYDEGVVSRLNYNGVAGRINDAGVVVGTIQVDGENISLDQHSRLLNGS